MKNSKLQLIDELISSIDTSNSDLQNFTIQLQTLKRMVMDDNYIDSSKTDNYLEKLSNEIKAYLSNNDKK